MKISLRMHNFTVSTQCFGETLNNIMIVGRMAMLSFIIFMLCSREGGFVSGIVRYPEAEKP